MAGRRRGATAAPRGAARGVVLRAQAASRETRQSRRTTRSQADQHAVPTVYRELLAEAGITTTSTSEDSPERPLKRPRTGRRPLALAAEAATAAAKAPVTQDGGDNDDKSVEAADESDEDDIDLVDVDIPEPKVQTIELSSEDESDGEDEEIEFEDVDIDAIVSKQEPADTDTGTLQLNLTATEQALAPSKRNRKQPLTKEEKQRRVEMHQMHLLCLLAHVEKRNHWCNDPVVQETLRPLLSDKTIRFLNPPASLNQFGQTESLKRGLKEAQDVFRHKFRITESGLRRALWAEDKADLQHYERPRNLDSCLDKVDFRKAAQQLKGSRDVAAQLFCALLRAVGVEARLVCSLQPLSFVPGGPTLPKPRKNKTPTKQPYQTARAVEATRAPSSPAIPSPRARLGHPHAAAYRMPYIPAPPPSAPMSLSEPGLVLQESPFPVYWTEVLDVGHQKWQPVDTIVTGLHFRPHRLEPPALDRNNILTYVVAFEDDGTAKDVTRRYAKAINSKTRRLRIDGPSVPSSIEGAKWWRRTLRRYRPSRVGPLNDLDQIEEAELTAAEAREPMPRNVADFKDHPVYALERHLRRHEVLIPGAQVVGTVGAGSKGPLEKIYRRRDVRMARTRDKWYRVGRIIKPGEEPVKVVPKRKPPKSAKRLHFQTRDPEGANRSSSDDEDDDPVLGYNPAKGNPLYTFDQTDLYVPPMVVGGCIPKNVYGNVDVYVPSMVPIGGVHIKHPRAAHAAIILGIDYAPALQGFEFKGRSGTAVYNGVVVPVEAAEGIRVVLKGLEEWEEEVKRQERRARVLEKWRDWERTLRIRKRVFWDAKGEGGGHWDGLEVSQFVKDGEVGGDILLSDEDEDEDVPRGYGAVGETVLNDGDDDEADDGGGGGFEPGGFEPEHGGFKPGDFEPDGFEPGGFEFEDAGSGGFEPGGFETETAEPGGFGAGSFEVSPHQQPPEAEASYSFSGGFEVENQNEEKDLVPSAFGNPIQKEVIASTAEVDLSNKNSAQDTSSNLDKGGVEATAEEEQSKATNSPRTTRQNDAVLLGSVTQTVGATIMDGKHRQQVQETDEKGDVSMQDAPVALPKSTLPQEHVGSQQDTEMDEEDGASETTEELFMDEDGELLE